MATKIGEQEFEIEAPDVVVMRWRGHLTVPEWTRSMEFLRGECAGWTRMILLADLSALAAIPPEVRKLVPGDTAWMPMRGVVVSGASFAIRTVAVMLLKVMNLLRGTDNPTYYARNDEEARAWIDRRRAELREEARR